MFRHKTPIMGDKRLSGRESATRASASEYSHLLVVGICSMSSIVCLLAAVALLAAHLMMSSGPQSGLLVAASVTATIALVAQVVSAIYARDQLHGNAEVFREARGAKAQTDELFNMTDMLQSADGYDDAAAVLMATSLRLLPEFGAALYIFNNSRDRLDLSGSWNMPEDYRPAETLAPSNCWTLKRGKPHINNPSAGSLCCAHHAGMAATLELPMMARGSVYGLLIFATNDTEMALTQLDATRRIGHALADSMSLALSNISLREKLRTQSLRDPLTGLYNRRYMEDALERYVSLAERSGAATTVLMMDLDNFKRLNDEFGHAMGDAVLRDVAAQLIGGLRPSDVACRYGGEELMIILPDCGMEDARIKAEALRLRVQGLTEIHQAPISVSIGIASIPETSTSVVDLVAMADAALYEAKRAGKNCLVSAEKRGGVSRETGPRLTALG
jgi:diguanylate cyclase (GGDEF)-like protein